MDIEGVKFRVKGSGLIRVDVEGVKFRLRIQV